MLRQLIFREQWMFRVYFPDRFEHIVFPREEKRRLAVNLGPSGHHVVRTQPSSAAWPQSENAFVTWLLAQVGLNASDYRTETLQRRLPACLRSLHAQSVDEAKDALLRSRSLITPAISSLLVGVTSFFRDTQVFAQLRQEIDRNFAATEHGVQAWSAGCSDGPELYSLAMILDQLGILQKSYLIGTDCRSDAIDQARDGQYAASVLLHVPPEYRDQDFERNDKCGRLSSNLRKSIRWRVADIVSDFEPGLWDIIFFRNTALYLRPEVLQSLWSKLEAALRPGGLLVLGRAERPNGIHRLRPIGPCLYRRQTR